VTATHLLALLDQAYDRRSWHGPNLRGSLRGVSAAEAAWRPARGRHNIWELVVHSAYWKYAVRRRLASEARGSFELKGSNWFTRPESGRGAALERAWRDDLRRLEREHRQLRRVVADVAPESLDRPAGERGDSKFFLISGVAAHDLYHAGQIQLLKRLARR
jgi:hypothetical protein